MRCKPASNSPPRSPAQAPGDRDEALAVLAAAAREAGQLGMVPFTEWIEQLQAQLTAAAAGDSPLSPRELEVARLAARGD